MPVERAFGLLVGRWGIFWKRLLCHQSRYRLVIRAAVRLHNIAQSYACEWTAQDEMGARQRAAMHGASRSRALRANSPYTSLPRKRAGAHGTRQPGGRYRNLYRHGRP